MRFRPVPSSRIRPGAWATLALALVLPACSTPLDAPVLETTVALPTGGATHTADLRDYLLPDPALDPATATPEDIALALQEGRAALNLVEFGAAGAHLHGHPEPVLVPVEDGRVPEEFKRGMLIVPLFDALLDRWGPQTRGQGPSSRYRNVLLLAVDQGLPQSTWHELLYTAFQARATEVHHLVTGPRLARPDWPRGDREVTLLLSPGGRVRVRPRGEEPGVEGSIAELEGLVGRVLGDPTRLGCAIVAPKRDRTVTAGDVLLAASALERLGVKPIVNNPAGGGPEGTWPPPGRDEPLWMSTEPRSWRLLDPLPVRG